MARVNGASDWRMSEAEMRPLYRREAAILVGKSEAMRDEVLDHQAVCAVQAEARRTWSVVGWKVVWDRPEHPGKFVARLLSGCPYVLDVLVDDTLEALPARLPLDLRRHPHAPVDAVEIWFVSWPAG